MTQVVLVSGHLVDPPDRATSRLPQRLIGRVADEIGAVFDAWDVGPGTAVICGGARGPDLIGAEQGLARGARVLVCLALPREEFERSSVDLPGTDWTTRFRRVIATTGAQVLPPESHAPARADAPPDGGAFVRANARMVALARSIDPEPRAVAVWDGKPAEGPGGTADLVHRLGYPPGDPRLHVIDPTDLEV